VTGRHVPRELRAFLAPAIQLFLEPHDGLALPYGRVLELHYFVVPAGERLAHVGDLAFETDNGRRVILDQNAGIDARARRALQVQAEILVLGLLAENHALEFEDGFIMKAPARFEVVQFLEILLVAPREFRQVGFEARAARGFALAAGDEFRRSDSLCSRRVDRSRTRLSRLVARSSDSPCRP